VYLKKNKFLRMKIALAQLNYHIGNFEGNLLKIKQALQQGIEQGVDLVVFSELAVCGYSPKDLLESDLFIKKCLNSVHELASACTQIAAIIGAPAVNENPKGKKLFNAAYFLAEGKIKQVVHKSLLPNYDVFDEYRYFEPDHVYNAIEYKNCRIALTICEDIWTMEDRPLYKSCPMDTLIKSKPDVMINIAASPFAYNHAEERREMLCRNAKYYGIPLFYINHVGAQTDIIFDGGSLALKADGSIFDECKFFEEDFKIFDLKSVKNTIPVEHVNYPLGTKIERIHDAIILGIRDYFRKSGLKKAVLGLSGGIDSAVVLVLAAKALGKDNVKAVLMPSRFSSQHSVEDAKKISENLGVSYDLISIEEIFNAFENSLNPLFKGLVPDITEENIQARSRGALLMALSNKFGYILLNTSNKSELAVGYGTLYGDMCGGLSILGDVYKTEVYELAQYLNKDKEIVPACTILKPPSAELRTDQRDSDSLPDYGVLDKILFQYIELKKDEKEIVVPGADEKLVKKILKLVNSNEYKRHQAPPVLRVSQKAFGAGRRIPVVARFDV
jgi:NAD+ synthase (glutamine-hydrolysing)